MVLFMVPYLKLTINRGSQPFVNGRYRKGALYLSWCCTLGGLRGGWWPKVIKGKS